MKKRKTDILTLSRCVQSLADAVAVSAMGNPDLRERALSIRNHLWDLEKQELGLSMSKRAWRTHMEALDAVLNQFRSHAPTKRRT